MNEFSLESGGALEELPVLSSRLLVVLNRGMLFAFMLTEVTGRESHIGD